MPGCFAYRSRTRCKLTDYVSQIRSDVLQGLVIGNVSIAESEGASTLIMDITLFTSPYASGPTGSATPALTPADLTQLENTLAIAWAAQDWRQIIGLIEQLLTLDASRRDLAEKLYAARVNFGYQFLAEGKASDAVTQFNLALQIKPDGEVALAGLRQALATPPATLSPVEQLALHLHESWAAEDWPEVIALLEQIRAIDPNYDDTMEKLYAAHVNFGYKLMAQNQLEEAKEQFVQALTVKPDGAEALAGLHQLAGDTPVPPQPPLATPTSPASYVVYVVQRGDTLYSTARRYGTTVEAIQSANGLAGNAIYVGQQLRIPTGSPEQPGFTLHIVQAGETLYSIARRYGTTVQAIQLANGLSSTNIRVGQ